jgi:protein-serine/threonine kinase
VTVEKAAAAKVFFECYYNSATSDDLTPRSLRRRQLEGALYQDPNLTAGEKYEKRQSWARRESDHLRETRRMKNEGSKALKEKASPASKYEVVKVLGKGSFGVVRLVREKVEQK